MKNTSERKILMKFNTKKQKNRAAFMLIACCSQNHFNDFAKVNLLGTYEFRNINVAY